MYETSAASAGYANSASPLVSSQLQGQNAPRILTVSEELINRLDNINRILINTHDNQKMLLERLHGPRPEEKSHPVGTQIASGSLGNIQERLNWIETVSNKILETQQTLDRLA